MIGFLIKKALYDGWDNFLAIMAVNIAVLSVGFGGFFLAGTVSGNVPLSIAVFASAALIDGSLLMACSVCMARVCRYKTFTFKGYFSALKTVWLHGMLFAALVIAGALVASVAIPYYLSLRNAFGAACAMLLFWVAVLCALSLQWFFPIRSQLETSFTKSVKKCFIIFFDNPGLSVFMLFYSLALLAVSLVLIMLAPGFSGLVLAQNEAFRLLMRKYDWLEAHPELEFRVARKAVPWEELIADDVETVGHRSLKSFIFPWLD